MKKFAYLENFVAILSGWNVLFRAGIAVAWVYPLVHVFAGRSVFCSDRPVETAAPTAFADGGGGGGDHRLGVGLWAAGEPAVSGVGLPTDALQLSGADMPALQPALDSGEFGSHGAVCGGGTSSVSSCLDKRQNEIVE